MAKNPGLLRATVAALSAFGVAMAVGGCASTDRADALTPGIYLDPPTRAVLPAGMEIRKVYDPGVELTKLSEGFEDELYNDAAGYCTIGFGHLIKKARCDGSEPAHFLDGVTDEEGTELLRDDMELAEIGVMTLTKVNLTDGQYAALVDFVFNVGRGNYGRSTLRKVINARKFDSVPGQLRRWVRAGGKVFKGLQTRREREIELFFEGVPIPRAVPAADEPLDDVDVRTGEPAT